MRALSTSLLTSINTVALLFSPAALGHSVGNELSVSASTTTDTDGKPQRTVSDTLDATVDIIADKLAATLLYSALRDQSGEFRHFIGAGADYLLNDHFSLSLFFSRTPVKNGLYEIPPEVLDPCAQKVPGPEGEKLKAACADPKTAPVAVLVTKDSTTGLSLTAAYDTAGDSNFETSVDLTAGLTRYSLDQIPKMKSGKTLIDPCKTVKCTNKKGKPYLDRLNQLKVTLGLTEILFDNTTVGLRLSYYAFDDDPTSAGTHISRLGEPVGAGIPAAPMDYDIRPSVSHRFGKMLAASLSFSRGKYSGDIGSTIVLTGKLTVKPVKALRTWVSVSGQRDLPPSGSKTEASGSNYVSLGASYSF